MYDLTKLRISDIATLRSALRTMGGNANCMEEVAERIVRYFYNNFGDEPTGNRSFALVRFYKTHSYDELDKELRGFASAILGGQPPALKMKCLTLIATVGEKPEWNLRAKSVGHKAIPLPSEKMVAQIPMIAQLIRQFGLEINEVVAPSGSLMVDSEEKTYNVFHVQEAAGSPYIPAQKEFVIPFGIKSVLGFGGMLPAGDLFAIILFSKVQILRDVADMFKIIALGAKGSVLPFDGKKIFA